MVDFDLCLEPVDRAQFLPADWQVVNGFVLDCCNVVLLVEVSVDGKLFLFRIVTLIVIYLDGGPCHLLRLNVTEQTFGCQHVRRSHL